MHEIFIDSTKRYEKLVRLLHGGKPVAEKSGDIDIVTSIADLLSENDLVIQDIKKFVANPGPGSFTGIKIGITLANVLNWTLGISDSANLQKPEYGREPNISKKSGSKV